MSKAFEAPDPKEGESQEEFNTRVIALAESKGWRVVNILPDEVILSKNYKTDRDENTTE